MEDDISRQYWALYAGRATNQNYEISELKSQIFKLISVVRMLAIKNLQAKEACRICLFHGHSTKHAL